MYLVFILCVIPIAFAKEQCITPNRLNGTCKSIQECDILLKLVNKAKRTSQDEQFLRRSQCGFDGISPKVCCPDSAKFPCSTPEGKPGECVAIQSCPHIVEMLKDVNNTKNMQYIKNSICVSPEEYSVCCGPPPNLANPVLFNNCEKSVSALLPDQESDCCGVDSAFRDKILAGNATFIDQYPWLVVIEYIKGLEKPKLICGGALISGKYVLTAAHCVTGAILRVGTPKYVRLGEYNVTNEGPDCQSEYDDDCNDGMIRAPIEEMIPHPEYDGIVIERSHDIALIRLKIFAPYTDFIRPICLPKMDYEKTLSEKFLLQVAGWGRYIQNITETAIIYRNSDVKRHVYLPYVAREKCQTAIRTLKGAEDITFSDRQICAGGDSGQGTCKGDSGGPLMLEQFSDGLPKYEVIGVLSTGTIVCGQQGIPSVFTHVYKYVPWIKANMKP